MTIENKFPPSGDDGTTTSAAWFPSASRADRWDEIERIGRLLDEIHPRPTIIRRPASEFAHLTDADELALELNCSLHLIDRECPEIQRLIKSTEGSVQGFFLAARLAPNSSVGKPKPIRRKRWRKGKRPILPNLFSLANELAAAQAADEN